MPEDFPEHYLDVWPDNMRVVAVFAALGTQWNVGHSGPIGLRYEAYAAVREAFQVPAEDWPELFDSLRICEGAVLDLMRSKQK